MDKIIGIELKRDCTKTAILILVFFILSVLCINWSGINLWKESEITKKDFIKNEFRKVESYNNYRQYGWSGFKMLFVSSPIASMFYPSSLSNMQTASDTSYRFDIFNPQRGEYVFNTNNGLVFFLKVIGGILSLALGFFAFRNREFIRVLLNRSSKFKIYVSILAGRSILVFLSLSLLCILLIAQYYILGVNISGSEVTIIKIMFKTFVFMFVFLLLGMGLGTLEDIKQSGAITFIVGLIFLLLWPTFFTLKFSEEARKEMKSIYRIESERVKKLHEFERSMIKYAMENETTDQSIKERYETFFNEGEVDRLEIELIDETDKKIKKFHLWSILNPATFYEAALNEISGNGLIEKQRFFKESVIKKREFSKYIIEKMFQRQTGKIEPFLSGDEYIFYAKPSLPYYFIHGVLLTLLYIVVLFFVSYSGFKKYVSNVPGEEIPDLENFEIKLYKGEVSTCITPVTGIKELIYNYLSGNKKVFAGKITFTGNEIDGNDIKSDLYYIPHPDYIPENIKVKCLFKFLVRSFNMTKEETRQAYEKLNIESKDKKIFAELAFKDKVNLFLFPVEIRKIKIVLFNEIEKDQTEDDYNFLFEKTKELKKDRFLLYMTKNAYVGSHICDKGKGFIPKNTIGGHLFQ